MTEQELLSIVNGSELMGDAKISSELDIVEELAERGWPDYKRWLGIYNRLHAGDRMTSDERMKALAYLRAGVDFPDEEDRI